MKKTLLLCSVALIAAAVSGCSSTQVNGRQKINVLGGLFVTEEGAYAPKAPVSITATREEWSSSRNVTGNQTSLLWGLINYSDY